jgi:hypothetical protein
VALAFVSGAFISSPELRASAAATIASADIVDGTIKSVDIGAGEIKTSDIGNGHVNSAKIKDGNVMTSDLANNAVTSDKLANGAVTLAKLGTGVADGLKGADGIDGIDCWDLNGNRINDESEDANNDNDWDANDCQGSAQFAANNAPEVDAGSDQNLEGTLGTQGGALGTPIFNTLQCTFPLDGSVTDDVFTGYLAHKWTAEGFAGLTIVQQEELSTDVHLLFQQHSSLGPITGPAFAAATLTADDGILTVSDDVSLVCTPPSS